MVFGLPFGSPADIDETRRLFFEAVKQGDSEAVASFLKHPRLDVDMPDEAGFTALHYAVAYKARAVMKLLVTDGCDLSVKDPHDRTAAAIAIEVADDPALGAALYELQRRRAIGADIRARLRRIKRREQVRLIRAEQAGRVKKAGPERSKRRDQGPSNRPEKTE